MEQQPVIEKKSLRLSMKKGPKVVKTKVVDEPPIEVKEEPPIEVKEESMQKVKKSRVVKSKKEKGQPVVLSSDDSDIQEELTKIAEKVSKSKPQTEKKSNDWINHVKQFRAEHPEITYKECLKAAKETYKKA